MSDIEALLVRARAALAGKEPESQTFFQTLPKDVPPPIQRTSYGGNSRESDKFVVRMPDDMRERTARFARLHFRSMNSEMLVAVEWWMDRQQLMWTMLQATERELAIQERASKKAVGATLDALVQRHPQAKELVEQLQTLIYGD